WTFCCFIQTLFLQIAVGSLSFLRGYRVSLSITNTSLSHFPSTIFHTLSRVNLLDLNLSNNQLTTLEPFIATDTPVVNQHGTILQSIRLEVVLSPMVATQSPSLYRETPFDVVVRWHGLPNTLSPRIQIQKDRSTR